MDIRNSSTKKEADLVVGSQTAVDANISSISQNIQLVAETNPKLLRRSRIVKSALMTNTSSVEILSVPAGKKFLMTSATLSVVKDATSTATSIVMNATVGGVTSSMLRICGLTLTAKDAQISISPSVPIVCDAGSIYLGSDTAVANVKVSGTIAGYFINDNEDS